MDHENHPNSTPEQSTISDAESIVSGWIDLAPTRMARRALLELAQSSGAAFAAYLTLDGIDRASPTLEEDFRALYIGHFSDKETLIDNELDALGWKTVVEEVCTTHAIPSWAIQWDRDALWDIITRDVYEIVELDGEIYVFAR